MPKMHGKKIKAVILLTPEQYQHLVDTAKEETTEVSAVARRIIEHDRILKKGRSK